MPLKPQNPPSSVSLTDYDSVVWVSTSGDASATGLNPAQPTTLANAVSTAPSGALVLVEPGSYAGALALATAGLTIAGMQSGFGNNSVVLTGQVQLSAASGSVTLVALDLTAGLDDTGAATVVVRGCGDGGTSTTFTRSATVTGATEVYDCDFNATDFTIGAQTFRAYGSPTRLKNVNLSAAGQTFFARQIRQCRTITHTGGSGFIIVRGDSNIRGSAALPAYAVDAPGCTFTPAGCFISDSLGALGAVSCEDHAFRNTTFDRSQSSLTGVDISSAVVFGLLEYNPATPGDWSLAPDDVTFVEASNLESSGYIRCKRNRC